MNTSVAKQHPHELALLVLDASGTVRAANDAAGHLWQTAPANLAGQPIFALFAFEVTSTAPRWRESQWEVLLATALGRSLRLNAQPIEPNAVVPVTIELQTAHGPDSVYFARIEVVPVSARAVPDAAPSAPSTRSAETISGQEAGSLLLAAHGPLGFYDLDLKTGRLITSPAWKAMLGYTADELPDTHTAWRGLIHPEDTAALPDQVAKLPLDGHRGFTVELRLRHRQGHYIWILSSGLQIFGPDRTLIRVLGVNADITERKEVEEIGLSCEERLTLLTDTDGLAVFDLNFTTGQHWFSPACATLLGGSPDALTIGTLQQALPAITAGSNLEKFLSSFADGESYATPTTTLRTPAGKEITVVLGLHRTWSRKGILTRVIGFFTPVSAGTGPISNLLFDGLLDTLSEAVIITDASTQVIYLNTKAAELTGRTLTDACAGKLNDLFKLIRTENGRADNSAIDLALASEQPNRLYSDHSLVTTNSAEPLRITWCVRRVLTPTGEREGIVVVFRNPAEMTLSPEECIRANRFESLGLLAGGISHDFNNLLTTILGGISTAKDSRDYTKLEDAELACLAAKSLTRQLLNFAKGGAATEHQIITPSALLQDAVRVAAAGTTATISVNAPENLSPLFVDEGQIIQVFQNLIINALQAMPDKSTGKVVVRALDITLDDQSVPSLPAGAYVQIEVQDNGRGIPQERLSKIFEPFYTTKQNGSGLGLATAQSIVRQHGGQITVASLINIGTTFTVILPAAERRPQAVTARITPTLRFGTGRILLLDDDHKIGELTGGMLTSLDYTFDLVRTGEDAITFYRRYLNVGRPYDAVILDLNVIGGMGGEECFKHLIELHPTVCAIANSGYDSDDMANHFRELGFAGYLTKPYRVVDLARIIKTALSKAS